MPWHEWVLAVVGLILLAVALHYRDLAASQRAQAVYWRTRYDAEHEKYLKLLASLVKSVREKH